MLIAVVGAAGLAACGNDEDSPGGSGGTSGEAGSGGAKAGGAGKAGGGAGPTAGAGGVIAEGGGGAINVAGGGTAGVSEEAGAAGSGDGGMGGEGGVIIPPTPPSASVKALSPLPALPADTTNQYADNAAAAALGQKLFFDKRFSGPLKALANAEVNPLGPTDALGKVSCATCHLGGAMSDGRAPFTVTLGTDFHTRNAPALVNSSFYTWTNWGGRFAAQWELPLAVAENGVTMNSTRLKLAHFIYDHYKTEYEAIFGALNPALSPTATDKARFPDNGKPKAAGAVDGPWELMAADDRTIVNRIIVNFGKALQAYTRKLVSRDAPFDQFVAANGGVISESARRGSELFVGKAKCTNCHTGPFFSDNKFHNLGVAQLGSHVPGADEGRFNDVAALVGSALNVKGAFSDDAAFGTTKLTGLDTPDPLNHAAFRTSSLREVALTGPYMHSGQLATLADVVAFYVGGGGTVQAGSTKDPLLVPLALSADEQSDLVEFLKTLNGAAVPAGLLVDTSGQ